MGKPEKYLTVTEVAQRLGVNPNVVRYWLKVGHLPSEQFTPHKPHLIPESALHNFERPGIARAEA